MDGKLFIRRGVWDSKPKPLSEDSEEERNCIDIIMAHTGKYDKDSLKVVFYGRDGNTIYDVCDVVSAVPRMKGQKYLIAPKNYGGKLQDDEHIICCDCDSWDSHSDNEGTTSKVHFRISVDETARFWIHKDLSGDDNNEGVDVETTQLNGKKVMRKGVQLNFGDEIIIIDGNEDKELHRFRFDMIENKEGHVDAKSDSKNFFFPEHIHSGHDLIFQEIVSYLSFQELKNVRQVNRAWEEEVTTTLLKKATVRLFLEDSSHDPQDVRMALFRFAKEMGDLTNRKKIVNMDLSLPLLRGDRAGYGITQPELNQTMEDFNRYFINLPGLEDSVKKLTIKGVSGGRMVTHQLWKGCLEKFQNVEDLTLDASAMDNGAELPDFSALHFPKLKRLELTSTEWFNCWMRAERIVKKFPGFKKWVNGFIQAIKNVEMIVLIMYPFAHLFLEEVNKGPHHRLPKLSGLNFCLLHPIFPQLLGIRSGSLTFLQLKIGDEFPVAKEEWEKLFENQGSSLKHLVLYFHWSDYTTPCIKMPATFPKLETLEILNFPDNLELTWGTSKPGTVVNYAKALPKLEHLSLFPKKYYKKWEQKKGSVWVMLGLWDERERVAAWNTFLKPCTTLKTLKIPHLGKDIHVEENIRDVVEHLDVHCCKWDQLVRYYKDIRSIATLFPGVKHDWILEIKNGADPGGENPELQRDVEKLVWKSAILKPY